MNAELEAERGISIRMRIGVNTGEVVAGDPSTGQTLVTGDTVNTAARLEAAAPPGEILIGAVTWRLVRDAVRAEPVEPLTLKGKAEPVPAWRVIAVEGRTVGRVRRLEGALVGREAELRRLRAAWADVVSERVSRRVTLVGPAGIGKSRLAAELGATVTADGGRMLRGRCLPYGDGATLWPLRELVVAATGAADDDPPEAIRARLEAVLAGHPAGERIAHVVGDAIGASATGVARADLFDGVRGLFEALSRSGPLLVVWDDLQWAEPMLLDLIDDVARDGRPVPLLTVCVGRDELLDRHPVADAAQRRDDRRGAAAGRRVGRARRRACSAAATSRRRSRHAWPRPRRATRCSSPRPSRCSWRTAGSGSRTTAGTSRPGSRTSRSRPPSRRSSPRAWTS